MVSAAYLASPCCADECSGAFPHHPGGNRRLLLVRVEDCQLPGLLGTLVYLDLPAPALAGWRVEGEDDAGQR